jgi:hypothetical protein
VRHAQFRSQGLEGRLAPRYQHKVQSFGGQMLRERPADAIASACD